MNATVRCELCGDTGWQPIDVDGVSRVRPCDCWLRAHTRTCADGVPVPFATARFANYELRQNNAHAIKAAREFLEGARQGLYLCGPTGTGKTRLASSLLNDAYDRGARGAMFVDVKYLIFLQLQGIQDAAKKVEANALTDRCIAAELLCFDDVAGGEKGSDHSRSVLLTVYDQRINAGRSIWTSNLDLATLAAFLGDDRLPSRIAGEAGEPIELSGADQRLMHHVRARGPLGVVPRRPDRGGAA